MIIDKGEIEEKKFGMFGDLNKGSIFIFPTDTIYDIACDAMHGSSIKKIRSLKNNYKTPFSIIVPSKDWIFKNCYVSDDARDWIDKFPGNYTLILPLKNKNLFPESLTNGLDTIGVRMPNHWILGFVEEYGSPMMVTSANKTGEMFMTSVDDVDYDLKNSVNFIVSEGVKEGHASKVINLCD